MKVVDKFPGFADASLTPVPGSAATTLFVGIAFATGSCPETILANDGAQTSKALHAQITQSQAEKAALAKVPGGKVKAAKLSQENGQPIWSIDILTPLPT